MPGPRERDLEATRKSLATWLRERLGSPRRLELSELAVPGNTGFSSDTLLFEARVEDARGERLLRLVARLEPRGFNVFPRYDVAAQYRVMDALRGTDVPVPRMLWLEEDASFLGTRFYVMERVEGRAVTDTPPYHVGGWVPELAPPEREHLWWNGLDALCRIHRLDWRALGLGFLDRDPDDGGLLRRHLDEAEAYLTWAVADAARYPLVRRALDWLHAHAPRDQPVRLCWGDARPSNQLFRGVECVAVLDWEMVRLGDPVQDLAWWLALDRCLSEGIGAPRLAGLPDRDATVARWREATGLEAGSLVFYEILALTKFAMIMARIGLQMKHYGILPPDAEMDASNLATAVLTPSLEAAGG